MKYRTKLYLGFGLLIFATVFCIELINYLATRERLYESLKNSVTSIAATTAVLMDKESVANISREMDTSTSDYRRVVETLREVRLANERNEIYIPYIYLIKPASDQPEEGFVVVADASEKENVYVPPGTKYPEGARIGIQKHLDRPYSPGLIKDRWGTFLAGYAPIFGPKGEYVATVGVNLTDDFVEYRLTQVRWTALVIFFIFLILGLITASILSRIITKSFSKIYAGITKIEQGDLRAQIDLNSQDEFQSLGSAINTMVRGLEKQDKSKLNLIRYVSQWKLEEILDSGKEVDLTGSIRKISILYTDIKDFTLLTDRLSPQEAISLLNQYFTEMVRVIFKNGGTLDKYIGDGLICQFGAPIEESYHEDIALRTAIEMHETLTALNQRWQKEGHPQLTMFIAIHTGEAILANVGAEKRQDYTAMGNSIKIGARLVEVAQQLDVPILVSEDTWAGTHEHFNATELGPLHLKGKKEPIKIYSISTIEKPTDTPNL